MEKIHRTKPVGRGRRAKRAPEGLHCPPGAGEQGNIKCGKLSLNPNVRVNRLDGLLPVGSCQVCQPHPATFMLAVEAADGMRRGC